MHPRYINASDLRTSGLPSANSYQFTQSRKGRNRVAVRLTTTAAAPAGQVSRSGRYSSSGTPKVQATPARAVRVDGGTRSQ